MDVGDEASVTAGVGRAVEALGGLDTLVNVAGILRSAHFLDTTLADFEQVLRVNLVGTFLVTRAALPALRGGTAPAVVNFSSTSAHFAHPYMSAYAASKGGILAMTHALAAEFAKEGIRFNSVQPGSISSGMTDGTGRSQQSVGPGSAARRRLQAVRPRRSGPAVAEGGDLRRPVCGGCCGGDVGQSGGLLRDRHRGAHRRRRAHVASSHPADGMCRNGGFGIEISVELFRRLCGIGCAICCG